MSTPERRWADALLPTLLGLPAAARSTMKFLQRLAGIQSHTSPPPPVDQVEGTHERVTITRHGTPVAVLVSPDDLEALEETLDLLSDPDLMVQLRQSQEGTVRVVHIPQRGQAYRPFRSPAHTSRCDKRVVVDRR